MLRGPCPRCGAPMPIICKPTSVEEAMWGGWTCTRVRCKVEQDRFAPDRVDIRCAALSFQRPFSATSTPAALYSARIDSHGADP